MTEAPHHRDQAAYLAEGQFEGPAAQPAGEHPGGIEPDVPPSGRVLVWVGTLSAVILLALIALWQAFAVEGERELQSKDLGRASEALVRLRQRDEQVLERYDVVDAERGVYRIPLRRAMKLLLAKPEAQDPLVQGPPVQAPARKEPASP